VTAIGVLCARVRVEEKQIIAAIGEAGSVAVPVPPASAPLPPGPASPERATLGALLDATTSEPMPQPVGVLIDRAVNRSVAAATLPLVRLGGIRTIDAGIAATNSRLQVASALAVAGVPRPPSLIGFSEASSVAAAAALGYPSTMLGATPGSSTTHLHDADTADAVIEHRVVLGEEDEAIVLLQAGAPADEARTRVHVVAGRAIAMSGAETTDDGLAIAEQVARVLQARMVTVELARTGAGLVAWDVLPVSEFRQAQVLGDESVAGAIARVAIAHALNEASATVGRTPGPNGEGKHGFALNA